MHTLRRLRMGAPEARTTWAGEQAILWACILLAAAWRLARLDFQPLWWDEGWSVYFATVSVPDMLRLTAVDIHPPLYYLLLQGWTWLFGPGVWSVRLVSVLVGVAAVPVMYAVGRRLMGVRLGLIAAFLLAIAPLHIYYSQEVRMYGLVMLAGLGAFYFALAWRQAGTGVADVPSTLGGDPPRAGAGASSRVGAAAWAGYVVSAAAALYTKYYAAFQLLALNLTVVEERQRRTPLRREGE